MAVVPRRRKSGIVYYVAFTWQGKRVWERSGPDKREAERLDARRVREVKAGLYQPEKERQATTFRQYAGTWGGKRKNRTAANDVALLDRHVLTRAWFADMALVEVRPKHLIRLVNEMTAGRADGTDAPPLSGKSIALVAGILRTLFRDAQIDELVQANPVVLPPGLIQRRGKKREPYMGAEVLALVGDRVRPRERIFNALAFYTGMREGEVCGLRWRDYLGGLGLRCLMVDKQYDGQPLKTDRPRVVPVHPELEEHLARWRGVFELAWGHPPTLDDPIVPDRDGKHQTKSSAYKAWIRSCAEAGVTNRSLHSTRHTFISFIRRGGARKDVVERITHNAGGDIVDQYTTFDWAPFCEAMMCFRVDGNVDSVSRTPVIAAPAPGLELGGSSGVQRNSAEVPLLPGPDEPPKSSEDREVEVRCDAGQQMGVPRLALAYAAHAAGVLS